MAKEASTDFSSASSTASQDEQHRQEQVLHYNRETAATVPSSVQLVRSPIDSSITGVTRAPFGALQSPAAVRNGQPDSLTQLMHAASGQIQRTLSDQVTPLRLAGHLSVLAIAAVVLILSQISIPEWELSLEPTPAPGATTFLDTAATSRSVALEDGFTDTSLKPNIVLTMGSNTAKTSMAAQETLRPEIMYYTVKAGDTVLGIANKFGLQPETLMWSNSFIEQNPDRLSIGDSLRILPVDGVIHVIARGDTLSSIADDYDTAMQAIVDYAANRIAGLDDTLPIGKEIVVPGGSKPFVATYVGASTAYSVARPPGAMAGSGNFSWPTAGYISQGYWGGHPAVDVAGWLGAPVTAADGGYVVLAGGGWNSGYGNYVIVDHGNGFTTLYAHLNSIFVSPGETVSKGQQVGTMGNTGNSTGPHLHFEIRYNDVPYNPSNYLK